MIGHESKNSHGGDWNGASFLGRHQGRARWLVAIAASGAVALSACGHKEETAATTAPPATATPPAATAGSAAAPAGTAAPKDEVPMANAVTDGKPGAAVDLRYDVPTKPDVNQPFTVNLEFDPKQPADSLDVEIPDAAGLTIDGERTAHFAPVEASHTYTMKLQLRGTQAGLYYVSVVTKLASKVQTDSRAFAVPVVIGTAPAAEKPQPQKDASGQPVQPMPAKEN